jgi:hypothetical protein
MAHHPNHGKQDRDYGAKEWSVRDYFVDGGAIQN